MALPSQIASSSASHSICEIPIPPRTGSNSGAARSYPRTVFDLLYDEYLPFRLYADHMLGVSAAVLAKRFNLPEHWVSQRIEAVCLLMKQVRLNLLEIAEGTPTVPLTNRLAMVTLTA